MTIIRYTLRDTSIHVIPLANWIKSKTTPFAPIAPSLRIAIAKLLKDGGVWEVPAHEVQDPFGPGLCDFVVHHSANEHELSAIWAQRNAYHVQLLKLLQAGADGDAAAAIEFCRLELAGKLNHGAFA